MTRCRPALPPVLPVAPADSPDRFRGPVAFVCSASIEPSVLVTSQTDQHLRGRERVTAAELVAPAFRSARSRQRSARQRLPFDAGASPQQSAAHTRFRYVLYSFHCRYPSGSQEPEQTGEENSERACYCERLAAALPRSFLFHC